MGAGGCGWPSSCRVILDILPSLMFKNNAPNSASADNSDTKGKMVQSFWNALLRSIGLLSLGRDPRKNIHAFLDERYDVSESIFKIISYLYNHILASGWVAR